jgi:hypothetical protein
MPNTEARTALDQSKERAQQMLKATAAVQEGATVDSWVTCLTLGVSILGALAGIPRLCPWRTR